MHKLIIASIAFCAPAVAVEINLPDDGWYQLQSRETYRSICTSDDTKCDVEPGIYILINHTSGERNENYIISDAETSSALKVVYQPATAENIYTGGEIESFHVPCPENTVGIGGSCFFTAPTSPQTVDYAYPMESETEISEHGLTCSILGESNPRRWVARMSAVAICATADISVMSSIDVSR